MIKILLLLVACLAAVWLWALIACWRRQDLSRSEKIAWSLAICSGKLISYFTWAKQDRLKPKAAGRYVKALDPVTGKPLKLGKSQIGGLIAENQRLRDENTRLRNPQD